MKKTTTNKYNSWIPTKKGRLSRRNFIECEIPDEVYSLWLHKMMIGGWLRKSKVASHATLVVQ